MLTPLTPSSPENWLTQANDCDPSQRIFSKCIFLGCGDSPENYREITPAEKCDLEVITNPAPEDYGTD